MLPKKIIAWVLFILLSSPSLAFESVDEQIQHYLGILSGTNVKAKVTMLERLQWSGLTDPRLYDVIESNVMTQYLQEELSKNSFKVLAHQIRALGYSGNEKYRGSLLKVKNEAANKKNRKYAKKALSDMDRFAPWNRLIAGSNVTVTGESAEVTAYIKMLHTNDPSVQKLAARAIYHEHQSDPELLALVAEKLKAIYLNDSLGREAQDTAAWLCKALGENGGDEYVTLLTQVADETPHKKIRKYAAKYAP